MTVPPLVHVVDDDKSMRTALLRLLGVAGLEARGYATAGDFLLDPPSDRPGCILLDLRMPGPSGLDLQAVLKRQGITLPVVFLTGYGDVSASVKAMKAGAIDFLVKPVPRDILIEAVNRAIACDSLQRKARGEDDLLRARYASLSRRERQVFDLLVSGMLNKEIADVIGVSERTAKAQRALVMAKLCVGSAVELGRMAERLTRLSGD